ncbi:MAG: hypothetical protein HDT27_03555 [Subdoligranulum sp.]|nr:hypothetical protein [Subdoligranulum sp.]
MLQSLRNLNDAIEIMLEIITSGSTTQDFEKRFCYFKGGKEKRIDSIELKVIHNIMGKVLKDSKVLPKALIMKYILSTLLSQSTNTKADLQKIYGVYLLSVLFVVFENKKSKDILLSVLRADNSSWYSELIKQIESYFSPDKITDARLLAQYKLATNEDEDNYKFRCKSLATIYNFFKIQNGKIIIENRKLNQLYKFITDDECFSIEHFIFSENKEGKVNIHYGNQTFDYQYDPSFYKKYVNSIFNFIFIPREFNSVLGNTWLPYKLSQIDSDSIKCNYSIMYLNKVQKLSLSIKRAIQEESRCKDELDLYFSRDFREQYVEFARDMLKEITEKIKS